MLKRWVQTVGEEHADFYATIEAAYRQPHRHYHTLSHLEMCFATLDRIFPSPNRRRAIELALWFHDLVLDVRSPGSEEQSAELAVQFMRGASMPEWALVAELILATRHREDVVANPAAKIVLDCDLSIFAAPREVFDQYEANIRKEFAWVSEDAFMATRKSIMERFANRPWIFQTVEMKLASEFEARCNLNRSIEKLSRYTPQVKVVTPSEKARRFSDELDSLFKGVRMLLEQVD
jgi:predicted metal-dependent HD superfamily phosphohydrolase